MERTQGIYKMNEAIFVDRDGTIIEERGYICRLSQSEIFSFAYDAIRLMNENGFKVIGISNQSGVARGICTDEQVKTIHREITAALAKQGAVMVRCLGSWITNCR